MTLEELRTRFWWLGPSRKESYIVALAGDTVTLKVMQCSWNRRTQAYEACMEREFAELGLNIVWHPFWSAKLQEIVDNARSEAAKAGKRFSEDAFVDERRRKETIPGRG